MVGDFNVKLLDPERGRGGGEGDRGGANYRRVGEYFVPLPPAQAPMVPGQEDVEHGTGGEVGEVQDVLHPGDGSPSLLECFCPVPQA